MRTMKTESPRSGLPDNHEESVDDPPGSTEAKRSQSEVALQHVRVKESADPPSQQWQGLLHLRKCQSEKK